MIKTNKVLNRILLPRILFFCAFAGITLGTTGYTAYKENETSVRLEKHDKYLITLIALVIVLFGLVTYGDYKKGNAFFIIVARKYLKQAIKEERSLKLFQQVLSNQQAMQNVSAIIFNNLRPSEQKQIIKIISDMNKNLYIYGIYELKDGTMFSILKNRLCVARKSILKVLNEHASVHPEFADNIFSAMMQADMIYFMPSNPIQQHTR